MSGSKWDPIWEEKYQKKWGGGYPDEALIRFIANNFYNKSNRSEIHILDLGCGTGSATWYLLREGFKVTAVDASQSAIEILRGRLSNENLVADSLIEADITDLNLPMSQFDCIIDMACLMCMSFTATKEVVSNLKKLLKPEGVLFSYTSRTGCWGDGMGNLVDRNTYQNICEGPFSGLGVCRFTSEEDIKEIYSVFNDIKIDTTTRTVNQRKNSIDFWAITCRN